MFVRLFILMLICHVIDDFVLQPQCLSTLKQKETWENCDDLYKSDWKISLLIHSFSWSAWILLPVLFFASDLVSNLLLWALFAGNGIVHCIVDDLKANKKKINLCQDQVIHLLQILITINMIL